MVIEDVSVKLGVPWVVPCNFRDKDGNTIDCTGGHVKIRISDTDGVQVTTLTETSGFNWTSQTTGDGYIRIDTTGQSVFSPFKRYTYEAQVTPNGGFADYYASGIWVVEGSLFP